MAAPQPKTSLRFGGFELQPAERLLLRDGVAVPLRAKSFDLLLTLAERAGQLVTKEELLETVWRGRVVEENNVAAQIAALRRSLQDELIVTVPGQGYRFVGRLLRSPSDAPSSSQSTTMAIRSTNSLFGREQDLARLDLALERPGCVTLVGTAGVGKTSLARAVVAAIAGPTYWIDLTQLRTGDQIFPALCRECGISRTEADATEAATVALRGAQLLALDNAEHLVESVADSVALLIASAPELRVLVTSQVSLGIEGERCLRLDPLKLPSEAPEETEAIASAALALFIDRVHVADGEFLFSRRGLALARRICIELDGLPLAIEMAAARVPVLGLEKVHDALAERFVALRQIRRDSPARHRTLQTALDWSYALLTSPEQQLLRALGVCAGGFSADLAAALVDAQNWDTIDHLGSLVKRSLVVSSHEDPPRYRLLETLRTYALARLRDLGEEMAIRGRHASAMVDFFQVAHDKVSARVAELPQQNAATEIENAREALRWAMTHRPDLAVQLSAYVARTASITSWRTEAFGWLIGCEALARDPQLDPRWKAVWARNYAAQSLFFDHPRTIDRAREAVSFCLDAGEPLHLAYSLIYLARAFKRYDPELDRVVHQLGALLDDHPDWAPDSRALFLNCQGHAFELAGDVERAANSFQAGRDLARVAGLRLAATLSAFNLARVMHRSNRPDEALAMLASVIVADEDRFDVTMAQCKVLKLRIMLELGQWQAALPKCVALMRTVQRLGSVDMLDVLAPSLAKAGRPKAAALLVGLVTRVRNARGADWRASESVDLQAAMERVLQTLGRTAVDELVAAGGQLDDDEAAALLLADEVASDVVPTHARGGSSQELT